MIVSASYKTDIPALYGRWFMNRLSAGSCRVVNPWGGQVHEVSLGRDAVDGFVFWTRNAEPFLEPLAELERRGLPFVVHYTVTGYPRALETSVPDTNRSVTVMRRLAESFGPHAVVWRYDPIVYSSVTPPAFHRATFARLAAALEGVTDEAVVSFAHIYRKTRRNLDRAGKSAGFSWHDPDADEKRALVESLSEIAAARGMRLALCAQPELIAGSAGPARCIDAGRLSRVAGRPIGAAEKGNRPGCECHASRDIGAYDTCTHGCVYCYAVSDRDRARARQRRHDPDDPCLSPTLKEGAAAAG